MNKKTDISNSQELTKPKEFTPTRGMEKWLDTAVELMTDNKAEIARESEMARRTWYDWIEKYPGFEDWYYAEYERKLRRIRPQLDSIGMKFAKKGEYQFWKDMQKLSGRNLDTKTPQTAVQVNITPILEDEEVHVQENESD